MALFYARAARAQALGLGLSLRHAALEMVANADHLFPLAGAEAGAGGGGGGAVAGA